MKVINRLVGTFLFVIIALHVYALGLGDWDCKTPYGNEIVNRGGIYLDLHDQELEGLERWYFYKGYIVGRYHNYPDFTKSYFVANELTSTVNKFQTEREWSHFIKQHELKPFIWTRWYDSDWQFFDDDIIFMAVFYFFISIPLIVLLILSGYRAIKYEKMNFREPYTIVVTFMVGLIFCSYTLELFPQSI